MKKSLKLKVSSILLGTGIFINSVSFAGSVVSLNTWDLVDSGKHLDWGGSTKYSIAFSSGVSAWNGYKAGVIRKDTATTIQDVAISDYSEVTDTVGVTYKSGKIEFNEYHMEGFSVAKRQNATTHELGHALGLGHNQVGDVMYKSSSTVTTLSANDKASYDSAYVNY